MDMNQIYLLLNAGLYMLFALWCALKPKTTSRFLGFSLANRAGKSEFIAVYGGLELGLSLFFLVGALYMEWRDAAILFAAIMYLCISLFRIGAFIRFGITADATRVLAVSEWVFAVWGILLAYPLLR